MLKSAWIGNQVGSGSALPGNDTVTLHNVTSSTIDMSWGKNGLTITTEAGLAMEADARNKHMLNLSSADSTISIQTHESMAQHIHLTAGVGVSGLMHDFSVDGDPSNDWAVLTDNTEITMGSGNDTLDLTRHMYQYMRVAGGQYDLGAGDDSLIMGTENYNPGSWWDQRYFMGRINVTGGEFELGEGNNTVDIYTDDVEADTILLSATGGSIAGKIVVDGGDDQVSVSGEWKGLAVSLDAGDDVLRLEGLGTASTGSIDGGAGHDILALDGVGTLAFGDIFGTDKITLAGLEQIDLDGDTADAVTIAAADVEGFGSLLAEALALSAGSIESGSTVGYITGGEGDSVTLNAAEWTVAAGTYTDANNVVYDVYQNNDDALQYLLIQNSLVG